MTKGHKVTILRSLIVLLSVSLAPVNGDFLVSDHGLMANDTAAEIIPLDASQYCFVDESTIRINLNITRVLNIINSSEDDMIMAVAVGDSTAIFIAPINGSRCSDNGSHDNKLSTTVYVIQMIIYSITLLVTIGNIGLHLLIKDLRTTSGKLIMLLSISVIIITFVAMSSLTNAYVNEVTVICVVLINIMFALLFVYQATKLIILYHFVHLMYQSYRLISEKEGNNRSKLFKYILFIVGSSTICYILPVVTDVAINGTVYGAGERYCLNSEYTFTHMMLVYGELAIFVILEYMTFAVGLTLYFLVSKNCCAMKSMNFRVTMVLTATVGISVVLLLSLNKARVPVNILIPAVTSSILTEQIILLTLFMLSNKALSTCKSATGSTRNTHTMRKTSQSANMVEQV